MLRRLCGQTSDKALLPQTKCCDLGQTTAASGKRRNLGESAAFKSRWQAQAAQLGNTIPIRVSPLFLSAARQIKKVGKHEEGWLLVFTLFPRFPPPVMSSRRMQSGGSSQRRLSGPGNLTNNAPERTLGRNQRDSANVHRRADSEDVLFEREDSDNNEDQSPPPPGPSQQHERIVGEKRRVQRSASRDPGGLKRSLSDAISEYVRSARNPKRLRTEPE